MNRASPVRGRRAQMTDDWPRGSRSEQEGRGRGGKGRLRAEGGALARLEDAAKGVPGIRRVWHRIKYGTPLRMPPVSVAQPRDRGRPATDRESVLRRYRASEVTEEPDNFALYRIIGNDLPPLHEVGQARRNLNFILEQEPELERCEKRFVVNRIVDQYEEQRIVNLLEEAGASYFRIPFSWEEYARVPLDSAGVPRHYFPGSEQYAWLREDQRERVQVRLCRYKSNYVVNNNGARNAALKEGQTVAKWVMPWDGNCLLTNSAYEELRDSIRGRPEVPYWLVRMVRVDDNAQALEADVSSSVVEEPQVVFRRDAGMAFDPAFPYGRRPKVELLWRLGVPGPWDEWGVEPWDLPCPEYHGEAGAFEWAGWVARLAAASVDRRTSLRTATDRALARRQALLKIITDLDEQTDARGLREK